jgi:hypothetical protein
VMSRRLVRRAALSLQGKEEGMRMSPGWLRRIMPFAVPAILLLSFLVFALAKK